MPRITPRLLRFLRRRATELALACCAALVVLGAAVAAQAQRVP